MARVPTDINDKPRIPVVITACGVIDREIGQLLNGDQINNISIANRLNEKLQPRLSIIDSYD